MALFIAIVSAPVGAQVGANAKMLFLFSEVGDSLFILLFSIFFFCGNLQYYLSLDDLTNVSKFPKEAIEGSPL